MVWAPSHVDHLAAAHIKQRKSRGDDNETKKMQRLANCIDLAAKQGGPFWAIIGKALDQVVVDYQLPMGAQEYLKRLFDDHDITLAEILAPFMLQSTSHHCTELAILIRKGLIYDLLVKISNQKNETKDGIDLEPLIVTLNTVDTIEEADDEPLPEEQEHEEVKDEFVEKDVVEDEPVEVTYSTHLRDREAIKQTLKAHEERHTEVLEKFETPKWKNRKLSDLPSTPMIRPLEEYDSPVVSKLEKPKMISSPMQSPVKSPEMELSFNGSSQGANFSNFDFSALSLGDKTTSSSSPKPANSSILDESTAEPPSGASVMANSQSVQLPTPANQSVDSLPTNQSTVSTDQSVDFEWSSIGLERVAHFKDQMALRCVAFSPKRDELIFGSNGSSLRLVDNLSQSPRGLLRPRVTLDQVHEASVYCCAFSSSGDLIATGSNDKLVKLLKRETSLEDNSPVLRCQFEMAHHEATVRKVAFCPNGPKLVSGGGGEGKCFIVDCETEELLAELDPADKTPSVVSDLVVPSERTLYTVLNAKINHWDMRTNQLTGLTFGDNVISIACSSTVGESFVATGTENGEVKLWDCRHLTMPLYAYTGHAKPIRSVSFVGEWIAAGSMEGLVSLHHMQHSSGAVLEHSQSEKVINVQIDPTQRRLATTSSDGWLSYYHLQ